MTPLQRLRRLLSATEADSDAARSASLSLAPVFYERMGDFKQAVLLEERREMKAKENA